ncbi:potassium channel family protein [Dissulfurispira thermophila]|nr:potassium channel family protein [Dissulfurispira thermophila]
MSDNISSQIYRRFIWAGLSLLLVLVIGTMGYWFIGKGQYALIDCLYMTVITIATIGYGEIIDMSGNSGGRVFTMFIALFGIGTLTYILSNFTAFVVEGELNETFRRRKMEKVIKKFKDHYIVCGIEGVGFHIVNELSETKRPHVIVDIDRKKNRKDSRNLS